ncbi:MAG TPA: hypothetical protein VLG71_02880, partial [Candidatus Limnocylindria bacterium]|nr:hypothetical protein [Candidatus Limnocylindria bacterium]
EVGKKAAALQVIGKSNADLTSAAKTIKFVYAYAPHTIIGLYAEHLDKKGKKNLLNMSLELYQGALEEEFTRVPQARFIAKAMRKKSNHDSWVMVSQDAVFVPVEGPAQVFSAGAAAASASTLAPVTTTATTSTSTNLAAGAAVAGPAVQAAAAAAAARVVVPSGVLQQPLDEAGESSNMLSALQASVDFVVGTEQMAGAAASAPIMEMVPEDNDAALQRALLESCKRDRASKSSN